MLTIIFSKPKPNIEEHARHLATAFREMGHDPNRPILDTSGVHYRFTCHLCGVSYFAQPGSNTGYCDEHEEQFRKREELQQKLELRRLQLEVQQLEEELMEAGKALDQQVLVH